MKISVCGKGGSGKSTVATLLALSSARRGIRTIVVDSDESNSGLYRMLGFDAPPSPLMELLGGKKGLRDRMREPSVLGRDSFTLEDLPIHHSIRKDALTLIIIGKVLQSFEGCACPMGVLSREFIRKLILKEGEVAIIDLEAGIEHFGRGVDETVDWIVLVVEPSFESIAVGRRIMTLSSQMQKNVRAVINKIDSLETAARLKRGLEAEGIEVVGLIPRDEFVFEACLEGVSLAGAERCLAIASSVLDVLRVDNVAARGSSLKTNIA